MTPKNELAEKRSTELSTDVADLYSEEHQGEGYEGTTADDFTIPLLYLLQKGSPQVDADDPKHIEGAKPGLFYNTVTEELYESPLLVVPSAYERVVSKWVPRDIGGGFRGELTVAEAERALGRGLNKAGNDTVTVDGEELELTDTRRFFALVALPDGALDRVVISLASTQIKKAANLMTRMQKVRITENPETGEKFTTPRNPPAYLQCWELHSVREENDKGSWYGWHFKALHHCLAGDEARASVAFRGLVLAGKVQAATPPDREPGLDDDIAF